MLVRLLLTLTLMRPRDVIAFSSALVPPSLVRSRRRSVPPTEASRPSRLRRGVATSAPTPSMSPAKRPTSATHRHRGDLRRARRTRHLASAGGARFAPRQPLRGGGLPDVGEIPCDPMPDRVAALGVYTPRNEPLQLPEGVGIELPPGTRRLLVLAHTRRLAAGPADSTYVDLELAAEPVEHSVNWVDVFAPVPNIFPGDAIGTVGNCRFDVPAHHRFRLGAHASHRLRVSRSDRARRRDARAVTRRQAVGLQPPAHVPGRRPAAARGYRPDAMPLGEQHQRCRGRGSAFDG